MSNNLNPIRILLLFSGILYDAGFSKVNAIKNPYQDYCKIENVGIANKNSLCLFYNYKTKPGPSCNGRILHGGIQLSQEVKDFIVERHNAIRSKVALGRETRGDPGPQYSATNMNKVKWNNRLAEVAQAWASQCTIGSDLNRNVMTRDVPYESNPVLVRQNLYGYEDDFDYYINGFSEILYFAQAMQYWESGVNKLNKEIVKEYSYQREAGHFTVMVYAGTTDIGCGYSVWKDKKGKYVRFIVCNYGPGGNRIGEPLYEVGSPASKCQIVPTVTTPNKTTGLCELQLGPDCGVRLTSNGPITPIPGCR